MKSTLFTDTKTRKKALQDYWSHAFLLDDDPESNPLCDAFANDCFRRAMVDVNFKDECDSGCLPECSFVKFDVVSISERDLRREEKLGALYVRDFKTPFFHSAVI